MNAAALIRDRLGAVPTGARQPAVDAVVVGLAGELSRFRRPAEDPVALKRLHRTLLWGNLALTRAREAPGYAEVAVTVEGVLRGILGLPGVPDGA